MQSNEQWLHKESNEQWLHKESNVQWLHKESWHERGIKAHISSMNYSTALQEQTYDESNGMMISMCA